MARLKKPLNTSAVEAANDQFYANHPEFVVNGKRQPLDVQNPDHQELMSEWTQLYLANGGELEPATTPQSMGKTRLHPTEPYVKFKGERTGMPIKVSDEAHVIFATSNCIYVTDAWPLRDHFVYMDIDPSDKVDFETMGLLWTDENGFPHYTDGEGRPTERVPAFVLAWSKKSSTEIEKKGASVALIFDRDRNKLDEKRKKVEQMAGGGPLPEKYRLDIKDKLKMLNSGGIVTTCLFVPKDSIDVEGLKKLMTECDEAIETARKTSKAIYDYISATLLNQNLFFNRKQIDDWLEGDPRLKGHLLKNGFGKPYYQVACETFDKAMEKLSREHIKSLDKLENILETKLDQIEQIDLIVEDLYEQEGEHLLWRDQFVYEALGFFAGTNRQHQIFEKYVYPLAEALSNPFGPFRNLCPCKTCSFFQDQITTVKNPPKLKTKIQMFKAKDIKLGTRTAMRTIDLFTKFNDNIAFLKARNGLFHFGTSGEFRDIYLFSYYYFIRAGLIKPVRGEAVLTKNAARWLEFIEGSLLKAKKAEGSIDEMVKGAKAVMTDEFKAKIGKLSKIGDALSLLGAASVFWYLIFKDEKYTLKDAMDLGQAITDSIKAYRGLAKPGEAALAEKFGKEVAKDMMKTYAKWTSRVAFAGGVFQVAGAYISLSDAADKGDAREFGWAAVTYTGASISMSGLALDVMPEPLVTKGAGVALNVIGGVIYLIGAAGEFITKPDDVERFLRNEGFWREESYNQENQSYKEEKYRFRMDPGKI